MGENTAMATVMLRHDRLVDALFAVLADGTPALRHHLLGAAAAAERDHAPPELVAAALLHDIGHLMCDERHEEVGGAFLHGWFPSGVVQPVRLHVAAKRYLCTISPSYPTGSRPARAAGSTARAAR
jgi:predicted HD phosphohydrolase